MNEFPILSRWQWERHVTPSVAKQIPRSVPWEMVEGHEKQALRNHSQTLKRLAERGGLSPAELYCVVHDCDFYVRSDDGVRITEQKAAEWLASACEVGTDIAP